MAVKKNLRPTPAMNALNRQFYWDIGQTAFSILVVMLIGGLLYLLATRALRILLARNALGKTFYLGARTIVKWIILLSVAVVVLQQAGIKITSIITVLLTIAGMIAIGFIAVWSILSNISSALLLMFFPQFQIGDEIEIIEPVGGEGLKGTVSDFNLLFTTLREKNKDSEESYETWVPNNVFFQKTIRRKKGGKTVALGQHLISKPTSTTKQEQSPTNS